MAAAVADVRTDDPARVEACVLTVDKALDLLDMLTGSPREFLLREIRRAKGCSPSLPTPEEEEEARRLFDETVRIRALAAGGQGADMPTY